MTIINMTAIILRFNTILALVIAAFAIALLFLSKKIAERIVKNKFPEKKEDGKDYNDKLLSVTLIFKGIAAGIAVAACIISLF